MHVDGTACVRWSVDGVDVNQKGSTLEYVWTSAGEKTITAVGKGGWSITKVVYVIDVDRIRKRDPNQNFKERYLCIGVTLKLEALATPNPPGFPSGEPTWSARRLTGPVDNADFVNADSTLSSTSGSTTDFATGTAGTYLITAYCCGQKKFIRKEPNTVIVTVLEGCTDCGQSGCSGGGSFESLMTKSLWNHPKWGGADWDWTETIDGWTVKTTAEVDTEGSITLDNLPGSGQLRNLMDLQTKRSYGDYYLKVQFTVPNRRAVWTSPGHALLGSRNWGKSGVIPMNLFEVQIHDSYETSPGYPNVVIGNDAILKDQATPTWNGHHHPLSQLCGAIYGKTGPSIESHAFH